MKTIIFWCCLLVVITTYGQAPVAGVTFPTPRNASFIYHPQSKALLLIGGTTEIPDSIRCDVWKWDGQNWLRIEGFGPGSRSFFPGDLNKKTGGIYSFGGQGIFDNAKEDMWSFDGRKWSEVNINKVGTRDHHQMVYVDHLNAFVLYGGQNQQRSFDTATWLLKDGKFFSLNIPGPGVRYHSAMAYDKNRKRLVLYGGGQRPDEHWEFDGTAWVKIVTSENPGNKLYHSMVYDDNLKMIILHGGMINQNPRDPLNNATPVTWGWDGKTWHKIAEERIFSMALGYDPKRKVVVAYGRTDNALNAGLGMWELKDGKWSKIAAYEKWDGVEYLKKWVEQNPDDMLALLKYADILQWQTKQFSEAEDAYKKLEKVFPQKITMLIDLAIVLSMQGKIDEAKKYLVKVSDAGLMNRNVYLRLAGLLRMEKKYRESIVYQEKALEMESKGIDFYNLAFAYANIGEKDKAFESLTKAADNGYNSKVKYENEQDFESLKSDARWKVLFGKLK